MNETIYTMREAVCTMNEAFGTYFYSFLFSGSQRSRKHLLVNMKWNLYRIDKYCKKILMLRYSVIVSGSNSQKNRY